MTTITYFWLKPIIYWEKVPLMANNKLLQTFLLTSVLSDASILSFSNISNLYKYLSKKLASNICCPHENRSNNYYYNVKSQHFLLREIVMGINLFSCLFHHNCLSYQKQLVSKRFSFAFFNVPIYFIDKKV